MLANVLYVAAHPDDENTRMISYLANHVYANTTYLSMTRGDGGQNLIGHDFREMLGIIRSQELLEARKIDGGYQRFTRANDFGYSKTARETFSIWDKDKVLSDVVWAIRNTKPDVIINRFPPDTNFQNHGHHTASAILSKAAFDLANDAKAYPDQLKFTQTWQPHRQFFNTTWWFYGSKEAFDAADKSKLLSLDIGAYDPMTGESNNEIAGRSRSMHKSQGFGAPEVRGESLDYLELINDVDNKMPTSIFDGIDITWNRIPGGNAIGAKVSQLDASFDFRSPKSSLPQLIDIYQSIEKLPGSYWRTIKLNECETIIKDCLGLFIEARTLSVNVSPGTSVPVTLEIINRSDVEVSLVNIKPSDMDTTYSYAVSLDNNKVVTKEFRYQVPDHLSIPYWLEKQPTTGMYVVDDQQKIGKPADDPALQVVVKIKIKELALDFDVPVVYKTVDPAEGEIIKPVYITPPVTVEIESEALVFNESQARVIPVVLKALTDTISGTLHLKIDQPGWTVTPEKTDFAFQKSGESSAIPCTITPPANETRAMLIPSIEIGGKTYHHKISVLDYDHLPYMSIVRDASTPVQSMDIKITPRSIAYIDGAGDDVAASLRQIGYDVEMVDPATLTAEILSHYQVVILGVRAFNTVESLSRKNALLFDWVNKGGTLITQYNTNSRLVTKDIAPYPITISRDRVTEENAPVTILQPDHPVMTSPNKITAADFDGWVQERGLYFPNAWDDHFIPLLEMHDAKENPLKGSLLVAPYGTGYYVYSGLSWFRHLPAGDPGPYRILSNIISLGYKNNKS
ncbi:MAG TPA: PIG-L family deacetylase [Saprospiraceae bacterium]|nr:PIG-L family deacetylase [Saprospiraceae bacterium]